VFASAPVVVGVGAASGEDGLVIDAVRIWLIGVPSGSVVASGSWVSAQRQLPIQAAAVGGAARSSRPLSHTFEAKLLIVHGFPYVNQDPASAVELPGIHHLA
jgi:hypothetical protein